jgi:hypothetical protein
VGAVAGLPLMTRNLLARLADQRPAGACCVVGITMDDLYPDPARNFAFGEASPRDRVGVYSFARYLPPQTDAAAALRMPGMAEMGLAHHDGPGARHPLAERCLA